MLTVSYLSPPNKKSQRFQKNYLDKFTVEFRFPALLEISQDEPIIVDVQKSVRMRYPYYEKSHTAELTPAGQSNEVVHEFRSKNKVDLITLRNSSVSYSTNKYRSFTDARKECDYLIQSVIPHLQTNFFTRIGMRYINRLQIGNSYLNVNNWINNELTGPTNVLGTLNRLKMEYAGRLDKQAAYLFRCGIAHTGDSGINNDKPQNVPFILDYDYSQLDVEIDNALALLDKFHATHFAFFWWSLGEEARKDLIDA